jgi:hypothetical protein
MLGHTYALGQLLQRSAGPAQTPMHNGPTSWLGQRRKGVGRVLLDLLRAKLTGPISTSSPKPFDDDPDSVHDYDYDYSCLSLFHFGWVDNVCMVLSVKLCLSIERIQWNGCEPQGTLAECTINRLVSLEGPGHR